MGRLVVYLGLVIILLIGDTLSEFIPLYQYDYLTQTTQISQLSTVQPSECPSICEATQGCNLAKFDGDSVSSCLVPPLCCIDICYVELLT